MRAFIILGFLVAASSAGSSGYNYGPAKTEKLEGSGSSLVGTVGPVGLVGTGGIIGNRVISTGNSGIISSGGYGGNLVGNRYGSGLISTGSGLIGTGNSGIITTGGYGGGLVGNRYGSGLISTGSGLIGTGNSGLISTGGYGGRLISAGGLIGGNQIIGGGSRLVGSGGLIGTGGSQIISGGSRLVGSGVGVNNVIAVPSLDSIPQTVEYSKQFFSFEAPEEIQEEGTITKQLSNVLKKNLQVVFIKAPENNGATNAALQLAKQAIEQKTDIYVLSKQNDGAQLVGELQQIQENVPTVPDVRIVKYRTPEDLAYAKEIIQAQYENTGGSTQSFDGGIAPVLNYASGGSSLISGGAVLGSNLGSTNIIGGGSVLGSGLGTTTTIIDNGPLIGSGLGSTNIIGTTPLLGSSIGSTKIIGSSPLIGSSIGSTKIIGGSPLLGSGVTTTKIINSGPLLNSGSYALGSNKVSSVSVPETEQYLPPLKKK